MRRPSDPAGMRWDMAEAFLELEAISWQLGKVMCDWSAGVEHPADWLIRLFAARHTAVQGAGRIVDLAVTYAGGTQAVGDTELGRLRRSLTPAARSSGLHRP